MPEHRHIRTATPGVSPGDAVLARLHAAEESAARYLAALEEEAVRRVDLVHAQAELDAELLRWQAHREVNGAEADDRSGDLLVGAAETIDRLLALRLSSPR